MSTQFLRSVASPTRGVLKNASAPKSIMKRPESLPLSPNPFPVSYSVNFSISTTPKSPHVRFPKSPNLVAVFSAHSPNTYDRAAIVVSPNPLAIPAWGDRVFSPSTGSFKSSRATKAASLNRPISSVTFKDGDVIATPDKALLAPPQPSTTRAGARFRENLANARNILPRDTLGGALVKFPRSPYPSAPLSPATKMELGSGEGVVQRRSSIHGAPTAPRPASLNVPRVATPTVPSLTVTTVEVNSSLSPVAESPFVSVSPETRLSNAFWSSLTLEQPKSILLNKNENVRNAEPDVPISAEPQFTFGTRDGTLWSPGLPRRQTIADLLMSPGARNAFGPGSKELLSPTPNDPFASFPSFAAVLSLGESVSYPSPCIKEASL